jgi:3-phenylpropionate/trans-cinnamate dioxygenase ferredoxin reductase subunit
MAVNIWDVLDDVKALIRGGDPVDPARLADLDLPIAAASIPRTDSAAAAAT